MAHLVHEDLWLPTDLHVVTTNSTLRRDGALIMGRGAAWQATQRFGGTTMQQVCGSVVRQICGSGGFYGFVEVDLSMAGHAKWLGLFQVKFHWRDQADLDLITRSVAVLKTAAQWNTQRRYRMNYPGIGNGKLTTEQVGPLLTDLPDNVTICYR